MLFVYFSTALDGVATVMLFILWVLSGNVLHVNQRVFNNPILLAAVSLYILMAVGTLYSPVEFKIATAGLFKYNKLILLVVLCDFLLTEKSRQSMLKAFFIASVITLIGSYLIKFNIIRPVHEGYFFKDRIDHGLFIAFFSFYCIHKLVNSKFYYVYIILLLLSIHNIFFICTGRIGQILCIVLMVLFGLQRLSKMGVMLVCVACLLFSTLFLILSENNSRLYDGFNEINMYQSGDANIRDISVHLRMAYWRHSLTIIERSPWFGHGTGSFVHEYQKIAKPTEALIGGTPHNEFLMIATQIGMPGLLILLAFFYLQYRYSLKLTSEYRYFAQGVLVTSVIASSFNPSFISHVKGYWLICLIAIPFSSLDSKNINHA